MECKYVTLCGKCSLKWVSVCTSADTNHPRASRQSLLLLWTLERKGKPGFYDIHGHFSALLIISAKIDPFFMNNSRNINMLCAVLLRRCAHEWQVYSNRICIGEWDIMRENGHARVVQLVHSNTLPALHGWIVRFWVQFTKNAYAKFNVKEDELTLKSWMSSHTFPPSLPHLHGFRKKDCTSEIEGFF